MAEHEHWSVGEQFNEIECSRHLLTRGLRDCLDRMDIETLTALRAAISNARGMAEDGPLRELWTGLGGLAAKTIERRSLVDAIECDQLRRMAGDEDGPATA